jgi:hypothetical protein
MLITEVQSNLNDLVLIMIDKGMTKPRTQMEIASNTPNIYIWIWWTDDAELNKSELVRGDSPEQAFDKAETWLRGLKNKDERNRDAYRKAVAAAIDLGNKYGIEDAAINPLKEVMEKLSKNALEHHPVPVREPFNDEIPF